MVPAVRLGAGLMLCLAVTPVWLRAAKAEPAKKPNLLLITADDLGMQLGCYGYRGVATPNLDRLAVEGVRFNRAYVTAASCSPSRASLLTGLYPHQNGQLGLAHLGSSMKPGLPNLVSLLKKQGYRTGQIGKLHVEPEADFPFDEKHSEIEPTRDPQAVRALCEKFLRPNDRQPFLLYLNLFDPHKPFTREIAGSPKVKVGPAQAGVLSFMGGDTPELRQETADYLTCVNRLDEIMGEVLEVLRQRGLEQNTLVVFLSDNGPELPRGKVTCFEAGTRVPLLVRWMGRFRPGVREELVSTVDLLPTMLALVNVPEPAGLPGRSLVPSLEGRKVSWRETLATEFNSHEPRMINPQRALRDGRYKLILTLLKDPALEWPDGLTRESYRKIQPEAGRGEWVELYDLEKDPHEFKNLAGQPALKEVEARLLRALAEWRRETRDPLLDPAELQAQIREGARALETGVILQELRRKQDEARKAGQPIPNTVTPEEMEKLRSRPFGEWNPLPASPLVLGKCLLAEWLDEIAVDFELADVAVDGQADSRAENAPYLYVVSTESGGLRFVPVNRRLRRMKPQWCEQQGGE
jgi:N-sulfoglucosamine sulfohydrolase